MNSCQWCGSTKTLWTYDHITHHAVCRCRKCNYVISVQKGDECRYAPTLTTFDVPPDFPIK